MKLTSSLKKLPRQVFILGFVSLFTDFASEMLYPVVPIFLTATLGASMAVIGAIEGVAQVTAGLLKGVFGVMSDKIGKRSIFVVLGYGLSGIVKPLPGLFPYVSTVVASRTIDRVGKGIRTAPRDALLAAYAEGKTGEVFGFHRSMDTLGAIIGPLAALILLYFFPNDYVLVFLVSIIPSALAIFFTFLAKDSPKDFAQKQRYNIKEFWANRTGEYTMLLVLFTLFSFVNSSDVFLILKTVEIAKFDQSNMMTTIRQLKVTSGLHLHELAGIFAYTFYNVFYAMLAYPIGIWADKLGKKNVFIIGMLIFSLSYFGFALLENFWFIWLLFAFYGIYSAATDGVTKAWVSDIVPSSYRGSAIGLLTMCSSIAVLLGNLFTGLLWDAYGSAIPFLVSAVVSLVVAASLFLIKK